MTFYPIPPEDVVPSESECVHTVQPTGYSAWHEWAELASNTHRQIRCPRCGKYAIWMRKDAANAYEKRLLEEAKAASEKCLDDLAKKVAARKAAKRK